MLARHGGDEFALLLPGLPGPAALDLVEQLRARHPEIGMSCGVAEHQPGESAAQLMRRADLALYTAKAAGRGRCELGAGPDTSDLVADLTAALDAGEVTVHFQPILDLRTDEVVGVEALARWTHPERGPVHRRSSSPSPSSTGSCPASASTCSGRRARSWPSCTPPPDAGCA